MPRLRLEYVDPSSLSANPANWRRHPQAQREAFRALIGDGGPGWGDALIFNEATGRLIDGHCRRELAIAEGWNEVPVLIGSWSPADEAKLLATKDLIGGMASLDPLAFDALLREVDVTGGPLLDLLSSAADLAGLYATDEPDDEAGESEDEDSPTIEGGEDEAADPGVPDALFPSDNEWGIPTLDVRMQADAVELPVTVWGSVAHSKKVRGTYHCYTDDRRFEGLWSDPGQLPASGCPSAVEPNFSTHEQMPAAVALWSIYRKRWIARYWQSKGVRVFCDLNVHPKFRALNFLGLPKGWRAFATRSHRDVPEGIEDDFRGAATWAGTDQLVFAVCGGGKAIEAACAQHGWFYIPEHSSFVRGK